MNRGIDEYIARVINDGDQFIYTDTQQNSQPIDTKRLNNRDCWFVDQYGAELYNRPCLINKEHTVDIFSFDLDSQGDILEIFIDEGRQKFKVKVIRPIAKSIQHFKSARIADLRCFRLNTENVKNVEIEKHDRFKVKFQPRDRLTPTYTTKNSLLWTGTSFKKKLATFDRSLNKTCCQLSVLECLLDYQENDTHVKALVIHNTPVLKVQPMNTVFIIVYKRPNQSSSAEWWVHEIGERFLYDTLSFQTPETCSKYLKQRWEIRTLDQSDTRSVAPKFQRSSRAATSSQQIVNVVVVQRPQTIVSYRQKEAETRDLYLQRINKRLISEENRWKNGFLSGRQLTEIENQVVSSTQTLVY